MTDETQLEFPLQAGEVIATGTAVNSENISRGAQIEEVMTKAILQCYADGITDPALILEAKLKAFEDFKATF